jgi:hypothetical protein
MFTSVEKHLSCYIFLKSQNNLKIHETFQGTIYNKFTLMRAAIAQSVQRPTTGWTIGVRFPADTGNFSLRHRVQNVSAAGYRRFFPSRLKRPVREADHSPPSSAEFNNAWIYTSTPQYVSMARPLDKKRDNFALVLQLLEDVCGSGGIPPRILNLGTRWR